jgi:predicted transcriptional regulator
MNLDMPISALMSTKIISVTPVQKLVDVKDAFGSGQFHYNVPVIENGKLKGMVVLTDFMFAIKSEPAGLEENNYSNLQIKDIMRETVVSVAPGTSIREVARLFSGGEVHTIMVTENGELKGIVSPADILRFLIAEQK